MKYLQVKVFWLPITKEVFFEGEAKAIASKNQLGKFSVLPQHANFVTLLFDELVIFGKKGEKKVFSFQRGVMEVRENKVTIFLGL